MSHETSDLKGPIFEPSRPPVGREFTLGDLQNHLQKAIVVEMSTIPLYLFAFYSIKKEGAGVKARAEIAKVFREEMLHLALAANMLYSIGKSPVLYNEAYIPTFPSNILYTRINMNLRDGRQEHIQTFVDVEAPVTPTFSVDAEPLIGDYKSIGEFYDSLKQQLSNFQSSIQKGTNQINEDDGIWKDPGLVVVSNLQDANQALDTIITQGEGADAGSHHSIFLSLRTQAQQWEYHPVVQNPQTEKMYKGKIFYEVSRTFDAAYCYLLLNIERLYQVSADSRSDCTRNISTLMSNVLRNLSNFLVGEQYDATTVAAPCFNYYALDAKDPLSSVKAEIAVAVSKYAGQDQKLQKLQSLQKVINGMSPLPPATN